MRFTRRQVYVLGVAASVTLAVAAVVVIVKTIHGTHTLPRPREVHHKHKSPRDIPVPHSTGTAHHDEAPGDVRDVTIDGWSLHIDMRIARRTNDWRKIMVNGHEIRDGSVMVLVDDSAHVYSYLSGLPLMNQAAFDRHVNWMRENKGAFVDWDKYCKDLPDFCKA